MALDLLTGYLLYQLEMQGYTSSDADEMAWGQADD